jgi:hypothetical protein
MGLLNMPLSGAPSRVMKPVVDMPGKRKPIRKRPRKLKVRPVLDARAIQRVKGAL